jgi:hypothetical protein
MKTKEQPLPLRLGRRTKLTKTLLKEIKKILPLAIYEKYTYQYLQIPESTWHYWKKHAEEIVEKIINKEKPKTKTDQREWPLFIEFLDTVSTNKARGLVRATTILQRMMPNDWRALRMYLQTKIETQRR